MRGLSETLFQVSDDALAGDEEFVCQGIEGPDTQSPGPDVGRDVIGPLGAHLEVILEQDALAVEVEVSEGRLTVQHVENGVEHVAQLQPKDRERLVPLPVPVAVRDEDGLHGRSIRGSKV